MIELKCVNCGSQLVLETLPGQYPAAKCTHCKSLYALPAPSSMPVARPQVQMPKGITVGASGGGLEIRLRWLGVGAFVLLPFAIFWNGFMIVWHGIALSQKVWIMSAFGILHTVIGLGLIYYLLAQFLNTTVIRAMPGWLSVKHGPIPWFGNKQVAVHDIRQLFCMEKRGSKGSVSYRVELLTADGVRRNLLEDLQNPEQALHVEQALERHLNLLDTPVSGDYRG